MAVSSFLLALSFLLVVFPSPAQAQVSWTSQCLGNTLLTKDVPTLQGLECLFAGVLSIILRLVGIAMFVMLIVGGYKYLTAGGDPKAVEAAKGTLTLAVTGIVLAILAWFVLDFIAQITGVGDKLLNFSFFFPDSP